MSKAINIVHACSSRLSFTKRNSYGPRNHLQYISLSLRSLPTGDGGFEQVSYVANENGFQPQSSLLPQDHPRPQYVIDLLAQVDELVRQGATWDEQGRRLTR